MICEHLIHIEDEVKSKDVKETFRGQAWGKNCREWVYYNCYINTAELKKRLSIDSLVYAGRLIPNNELYESIKDMDNVFNLGDSSEPGRIMDAVWGGFNTVRKIESR